MKKNIRTDFDRNNPIDDPYVESIMIEFYGNLSRKCQKYILRKESRIGLIAGSVAAVIFSIPAIILTFKVHWVFILCIPALIAVTALAALPPSKNNYDSIMPSKVIIDLDNRTVISQSKKFHLEKALSDVVCVKDMGDWYHIYFGDRTDRIGRFVCQKDLIHGCTLEEFEALFSEKIIRKMNT